jgi:hypothetical protein
VVVAGVDKATAAINFRTFIGLWLTEYGNDFLLGELA